MYLPLQKTITRVLTNGNNNVNINVEKGTNLQSKQKITLIPAINAMKVKFCTGVSLYLISSPKLFYHILGIFNLISKLYMG